MFYILLLIGFLIRFLLIPIAGFKADMAFWKSWGLASADKGLVWLVKNTNYNYPPGFAYILYLVNKVYAFFKNPYITNEYWADNNLFYLFLIKIITIVADVAIVFLIIKIARIIYDKKGYDKYAKIFALLYFLNPAAIFDGSHWGQVDQFGLLLYMLVFFFLLRDHLAIASIVFITSVLMKFQNIIFIPIFYLFILRRYSVKAFASSLAWSFGTFFVICAPFFLRGEIEALIRLLTINADWFPWYSLNAFNLWWIASGLHGMNIIDKTLVVGLLDAKQIGLAMFIFAYFIACVMILLAKKEEMLQKFALASILVVFAFFHLLTQSHERYLFHVLGLLPLLAIFSKNGVFKKFIILYILTSFAFFMNLYISMFFNYPDQVFWPLSQEAARFLTLYISIFQMGIFALFIIWFVWPEVLAKRAMLLGFLGMLGFFGWLGLWKNLDYIKGNPVSLTLIKPIWWRQDFLTPVYNKTVNSAISPQSWNRLSDNYYFYDRGIGSHADSDIAYSLKGKFLRLQSDFGVDTEADVNTKVTFRIEADGREIFRSLERGRFDTPSSLNVDIRGVDNLILKIRKVGESNYGAHADWLNPIVIR